MSGKQAGFVLVEDERYRQWDITHYELQRPPALTKTQETIRLEPHVIIPDIRCPICLGLITDTDATEVMLTGSIVCTFM